MRSGRSLAVALVVLAACDDGTSSTEPAADGTAGAPASTTIERPPATPPLEDTAPPQASTPAPRTEPTTTTASTEPSAPTLIVTPFGVRSDWAIRIDQNDIVSNEVSGAGGVAVSYELQLGFDPAGRSGVIEPPPTTDDGQLLVEVSCAAADCTAFTPVDQEMLATIRITARSTATPLTAGEHDASFRLRFDDGATSEFAVVLLAEPAPSTAITELVAASSGMPQQVQTVVGVGRFAYDVVSAFDSIWVLGKTSRTVARVDATTGAVLATIDLGVPPGTGANHNRLTASPDAIWVNAAPAIRIDPADNSITTIGGGDASFAVAAIDDTIWTAGRDGIERLDPDGSIIALDVPAGVWFDLAAADGVVWALSQAREESRLIAFAATDGRLLHDIPVVAGPSDVPVRIVADGTNVVVGIDTSGGGGRTGRLLIVDRASAEITATVELSSRPEGIVLTPDHIWTSGSVVDRLTLAVTDVSIGFAIARGPDGSIWGTRGIAGSSGADSFVARFAPGDFAG